MGHMVAIGEPARVRGFALAGAVVLVAEDASAVRRAWRSMPEDTDVVILTPAAAAAIGPLPDRPLIAVLPGGAK